MRHNKKHGMKLGTDVSHTKAMRRSLTCALFENDRIKTNIQRAKAIRPDVDRVITWAKKGDLHSRRLAIAKLNNSDLVSEIFEKAAQGMWADRNGGYTRIMRIGRRKGDNAEMVIIELANERVRSSSDRTSASRTASSSTVSTVAEDSEAEVVEAAEAAEADQVSEVEQVVDEGDFDEPEEVAEAAESNETADSGEAGDSREAGDSE